MTMKERQQLIDETLEKLGEFFDSVQIFASVHEDNETLSISMGVGNYNATFGHVSLWMLRQKKIKKHNNERWNRYAADIDCNLVC